MIIQINCLCSVVLFCQIILYTARVSYVIVCYEVFLLLTRLAIESFILFLLKFLRVIEAGLQACQTLTLLSCESSDSIFLGRIHPHNTRCDMHVIIIVTELVRQAIYGSCSERHTGKMLQCYVVVQENCPQTWNNQCYTITTRSNISRKFAWKKLSQKAGLLYMCAGNTFQRRVIGPNSYSENRLDCYFIFN